MMFKTIHGLNQFITGFIDDMVKLKSLIKVLCKQGNNKD